MLWYSQAAFKLTTLGGKVIMIDPWIMGATKIPPELKDLSKIGEVDLILVTHGHGDHLGDAMEISKTNNVPMWAPAGLNQTLLTLGLMPANLVPRMNESGTIEPFPGVKITQVHAEHSSEMILKDPATGKDTSYFAGEPVGFIIPLDNGFKIYHMGDTGLFGDMKFIGEYHKPDRVLVPIGGHFRHGPEGRRLRHQGADQAQDGLAHALRQQPLAPGHAGAVQGSDGSDDDPGDRRRAGREGGVLNNNWPESEALRRLTPGCIEACLFAVLAGAEGALQW